MKVLSDIVYIMSAPKGRDLNHYWVEIQQTMRKCYIFTWKKFSETVVSGEYPLN